MSQSSAIPLTGTQYNIAAGDYRATVAELGAGLRSLTHRGKPLITSYAEDELPPAGSGQLLLPWPNRIDHGRYEFEGATYQLELSEAALGNAIHGLTRWANWYPTGAPAETRADPTQASAEAPAGTPADNPASNPGPAVTLAHLLHGRPGYPFCLQLTVTYSLDPERGLRVDVTAVNAGSRPAPYGTGCHPYLTTGAPLVDDCELELPASLWLPADQRGIPSGPPQPIEASQFDFRSPRPIDQTSMDHALTGLTRDSSGLAWARLAGHGTRLGLWAGPGYDWLQVFTGDALAADMRRRALAIEPMTCPANAFVSGDGLLILAPGDSVTHSWGIEVLNP